MSKADDLIDELLENSNKAIEAAIQKQKEEDAKLSPEELEKVLAERQAAKDRYDRVYYDGVVKLEDIDFNGHSCILDYSYKEDWVAPTEFKYWGKHPEPDAEKERDRAGHISVEGLHMTCWKCGAFTRYELNPETNKIVIKGERYEYDPMEDIGMEHPGWDDYENKRELWKQYDELRREAQIKQMQTQRTIKVDGCPYHPEMETVVRVAFPSGKAIADDSLREVYNPNFDDGDYNTAMGQALAVERNAEVGCAYFPCGNSCPSIYRLEDGTYMVGSFRYDEETDEEKIPKGAKEMASICTDLWATSIADYDDWVAKGGQTIEQTKDEPGGWTRTVFDIEPGIYEFTYLRGRADWQEWPEDGSPTIYATFKRVGDCE
jgi:hypothetical protein